MIEQPSLASPDTAVGRLPPGPPPGPGALLTVIMPVYNEAATAVEAVRRVLAIPYAKELIIVDDGSTDGTGMLLEEWADHPEVVLLRHRTNRGKGAAIRTALQVARGHFTVIQDADLEYDPQDYPHLLEPLLSGQAQVVYGSRYLRRTGGPTPARWCHRFGIGLLNLGVRILYGARLTDEATCYKAFPTSVLRQMDLRCERFEFCPEVTAKACRLGLAIREVPIHYQARTGQAGKKIRWRDGIEALKCLWHWRRWEPRTEG